MGRKPVVLMILDGYGLSEEKRGNAVGKANTPVMDDLMANYPFVHGHASGEAVGLPEGQMGNSEVGHLNIGAGRVVYQDLTRISKAIEDGSFFKNEALLKAMENCKKNGSTLHICGLLSDGGVHSYNKHLYAILEMAEKEGLGSVQIHAFTDGRDTDPKSGINYVKELEAEIKKIGVGKISTITGRYYAMDRDNRWDRVEQAYRCMTEGKGVFAFSPEMAVYQSYEDGETDEFIRPTVISSSSGKVHCVEDGDSLVCINFRPDRAREITRAFCDDDFTHFDRGPRKDIVYVCMTDYDVTIPNKLVAFEDKKIKNTLGEVISKAGLKQLRTAETEKYAHVTFFFNGGVEVPYKGEDRLLVPSPKVATYDLQPEMSADEVCDGVVNAVKEGKYDFIVVNFANPDMVGHTGIVKAAITAIEKVDECVGRIKDAIIENDGALFICADHGNAEKMLDNYTGKSVTAHTTNDVPFILVNDGDAKLREGGSLCDIAPTILEILDIEKPAEMTGESLIVK